jgi:hypothetical protein
VAATAEVCDGVDNDCDGATDEQLDCNAALACPAPGSLRDGHVLEDYAIDGTRLFAGDAQRWTWTVTGGPCEQLFAHEGKESSLQVRGADSPKLTFQPTAPGDYLVTVAITTRAGATLGCRFPVHVAGTGVFVELCWDTTRFDDVDLHLHEPGSTASWLSDSECNRGNCRGSSLRHLDWGYPRSPLAACVGGPDGEAWAKLGGCINPRLIDSADTEGRQDTVALDAPANGASYRTMAHYFAGLDGTHPLTNIYCQGRLVASFGQGPDLVGGFDSPGTREDGSMWRVADIVTHVDSAGATTCDVTALHPAGQPTGYDVRTFDLSF